MKRFTLSVLAATVAAFVAMNAHTLKVKAQVLGTGMAQTMTALTLSNTTNQLVLGTTNTVTISSTAPASSRTYTLPDAGAAANFGLFANPPASLQNQPLSSYVTAQYTNGTTSFSNITGMSWAIAASQNQHAVCRFLQQSTTGGAGNDLKIQVTGPAAPTAVAVGWTHGETTTTVFNATATAFSSAMDPNQTIAAGTNLGDTLDVSVVNGTNAGTVQVQGALHTAAGNMQVQIGASCIVQ